MAGADVGGSREAMRSYATATAFRRALEDRLAVMAKSEGTDLQRMRRQVAFDRLLVRLFHDGNPPWCLKGGYALELKLSMARTTRDIDLGMSSSLPPGKTLLEVLQSAAGYDAGDHFVFMIGEPMMDLDGAPYGGARHPVEASLDGRTFARFHLDVGLGDIQREPYELVEGRDWLGFAGIRSGAFPSISREEHFAQKLHAYTMPRNDRQNSRVKDLVDMVLLIDSGRMVPGRLAGDIQATFRRRNTHDMPVGLEPPPGFWTPVFAKLANECGIDPDIGVEFEKMRSYYDSLGAAGASG